MQKVPEFVVHERMTKGEEVKCTEEKKKVEGWSVEEMSDRHRRNDKMERFESGREIDQCWKILAENLRLRYWTSTRSRKAKETPFTGKGAPMEWRRVRKHKKYRIRKWREDCGAVGRRL